MTPWLKAYDSFTATDTGYTVREADRLWIHTNHIAALTPIMGDLVAIHLVGNRVNRDADAYCPGTPESLIEG